MWVATVYALFLISFFRLAWLLCQYACHFARDFIALRPLRSNVS